MMLGSGAGHFPLAPTPSTTYDVNIKVNSIGPDLVYYGLWIDWDNNGIYEDFYTGSQATSGLTATVVTITSPFVVGKVVNVRLRADDNPFEMTDFEGGKMNGEVEDYQAIVVSKVEISYFKASFVDCDVKLSWRTTSEENFSYFVLEKSIDRINFETIGIMESLENSAGSNYQYLGQQNEFISYYRLKYIYLDGSIEYSDEISAETDCKPNRNIELYPNPLLRDNGILNINFFSEATTATFNIIDALGRVVMVLDLELESEWNQVTWDISELPPGRYVFMIIGKRNTESFIIQE